MYNSKISGLGKYLPDNVITNDDLSKIMDTSNEWIIERTGIKERRHIRKGDGDTTATMGVKAAKIAIERAGIDKNDIDLILFATLSPDYYFPGSGVLVQELLEIPTCPQWILEINALALFMQFQLQINLLNRVCIKIF